MWGASAVLPPMLPHDVCPRSVIDKPHCAPLKHDSQLHKSKATKKW